ncbi:Hypothetical protein, putative [Bodo saltans]|uniref:Uncharacterized protein n=1 Tax=Bodo saltans TaxID=75058 RepID=A0A0S4J5V3_BODSA|nr:Hypothetical protein, putative [Bodo saltans]|eukprot:CUG86827.1 Hypothetical protein, putative [Bodo saltans]
MHHAAGGNVPPSSITSHSSPRSYDVSLLFCIRAVNLAWQDARRIPSVDQVVSQWLLQRVAYFHTVVDEGTNPRLSCPTDVEMQPLRETSSSVSPQRTSASLTHQPSLGGVMTFPPHASVPEGFVDFSSIAVAANHHSAMGGGGVHYYHNSTTNSSPRSYDVSLLFCIRAVNLAWQDARRIPSVDQVVSQWLLQRVAYFHTVVDEGTNPRLSCPTDVEMQPLRETSSSVSPQRTSASLTHQPSLGGVMTFPPHASVPEGFVDFSSIAVAANHHSAMGGGGVHYYHNSTTTTINANNEHGGADVFNISRISEVGASPGGETVDQTPQFARNRPSFHLPTTSQRSGKARAPSYPPFPGGTAPRTYERYGANGGGGGASAYRYTTSGARGAGDIGVPAAEWGEVAQQALCNKGFVLMQELLLLCLDLDESFFCTMIEALFAVLPRPQTTHAEITLAMFENYPYLVPSATNKPPLPDMIVEAADNATGCALKSFLVYMNIAYNCGSFERQCEVLEMCKVWRQWLQQAFGGHVAHVASNGPTAPRGDACASPDSLGTTAAAMLSPSVDPHHRPHGEEYTRWSRAALTDAIRNDSTVEVEQLVHEAMLAKDVFAVANSVHRYFEHRLGADGTGRAILEVLLDPTVPAPPPTNPISFLFGVIPTANRSTATAGNAPPPAAIGGASASGSSTGSAFAAEIHAAMSCGILTFGHFYYSLRSTKAAMRCAEMAVLNGHQSGGIVDTLSLAHLLKSRCHVALGQLRAAAEDISIALQLSAPPYLQQSSSSTHSENWWIARTMAFQAAAELLVFFPSAVDAALRGIVMQHPLPLSTGDSDGGKGGDLGARGSVSNSKALEVIQTIPQSVVHAVWCAGVAMMGNDREAAAGTSFQAISSITNDTIRVAATSLGVTCFVAPITRHTAESVLSQIREDCLVLPLRHIMCSVDSVILELAKLASMQAIQQALGEYAPPSCHNVSTFIADGTYTTSPPPPTRSTTAAQGSARDALTPLEELLEFVQQRHGTTDILDRCTHFAVAVDALAAHILMNGGFVTLAHARIENALARLFNAPHGRSHLDDEQRWSVSQDCSDASEHWPVESLMLLLLCSKILVEILLFQGNVADAQRAVDHGLNRFTQCAFARGILQCHLLQASIWQSRRERSAQVKCLTAARDSAIDIGYVPLAASAHLQLVGAHIAVEDFVAAAAEWNAPVWRQTLLHHATCDPQKVVIMRMYRTILQVTCRAPGRVVVAPVVLGRLVKCCTHSNNNSNDTTIVSLQTRLAACSTVVTLAALLRQGGPDVEGDPLPDAHLQGVQRCAAKAFTHLRSRRLVDSWRGIGDTLLDTCRCVRDMTMSNSAASE